MNSNLIPYVAVWAVVALSVIVLLVMRKMVASKEDDQLHVLNGASEQQVSVASKLEVIDRWGKILTVVAVVLGLAIATVYVYTSFATRGV
jgi:preprotein translocase subunit SecG